MLDPNYIFRLAEESPIETEGASSVTATRIAAINYTEGDYFDSTHQDTYVIETQTGGFTIKQSDVTEIITLEGNSQTRDSDMEVDTSKMRSNVTYNIGDNFQQLDVGKTIGVANEIGDSECDYVLYGHNPDDGSDNIAFGFLSEELEDLSRIKAAATNLAPEEWESQS